ncbi:zinc finger protein 79 [Corythoichthys intestinalis]|uniref:zinc finger protein 79 n=1 Tax=Corythoichthys intestinalis TaxID=161448 RepID=UPI0025A633EC|nr:zinc finger protein 79 [Corythoichthys intestinalis]XP_057689283.1 zinc finger protein 79 [Corythoichthys intestinalis]
MSVQYTIDIQLTELGFPDILQPQESLSTSCDDSLSPCHSPVLTKPDPHKGSQVVKGQSPSQLKGPQPPASPVIQTSASTMLEPSPSGQQIGGMASSPKKQPVLKRLPSESDSEDSDVSVNCFQNEEEDDDEDDDEDPDELDNEPTNSGDHVCSVCGLRLPSNFKLQDHMNLHTGARPYCCAECGKRFSQIHNYRAHLRTHGQSKAERPHCRICLVSFASHESLEHHLLSKHLEDKFYECDLCKRVFTTLKACEHHVELHRTMPELVCEKCGRHFTQARSLRRHQRKACHRVFKCTDCPDTFGTKDLLLKHSFSHLGLLPYTCVSCRCHFRLAKLYRQHKCEPWRIHCEACLREFSCRNDFLRHKEETGCWGNCDIKGDEIRCLECGLRFGTTEELKKHGGAHQRVLKCAECGKGFRSALLLMSHMGGHAGNSPCLCQSCGLGFPHQQNYESHMKTCGKTPQPAKPATHAKKHLLSKNSNLKMAPSSNDTSSPAPALPEPTNAQNTTTSPATNCAVLQLGTQNPSNSDGCWKLTLDKLPPPGSNLLLFVTANTETLTFPLSQAVPAVHQSPNSQDADCEPMDLSKKESNSIQSGVLPAVIKSEPGEFDVSGEATRQELNADCLMDLSTTSRNKTEPHSAD